MKVVKSKQELEQLADKYSENIVLLNKNTLYSNAVVRPATKPEKNIIKNILLGVLNVINDNHHCNEMIDYAARECAENILAQFIPECDTYNTICDSILVILKEWEVLV